MPLATALRCRCVLLPTLLVALAATTRSRADQILQLFSDSLTTYEPLSATPIQDISPRAEQRGVGIDGSLRAAGAYPWALAGNPFGDAVPSTVRLGDVNVLMGTYSPTDVDLALPGARLAITRTFNGRQVGGGSHYTSNGLAGHNWDLGMFPELAYFSNTGDHSKDVIVMKYGADRYIEFQRTGASANTYRAVNGAAGIIKHAQSVIDLGRGVTIPDYYTYYDQAGNQTAYLGPTGSGSAAWQFWRFTDAAGNEVYIGDASDAYSALSGYTSGKADQVFDAAGHRYCITRTTIGGAERITQILVESQSGGSWHSCGSDVEVAKVTYDYYTSDADDIGLTGDLEQVTVERPLTDSGVLEKDRKYYRYYTRAWAGSDGRRGDAHEVKLVLGRAGTDHFDQDQDGLLEYGGGGSEPEYRDHATTDADLMPYCDVYLEYGSGNDYRITSAFFNGECGCSGGINGTYTFDYDTMSPWSGTSGYDTTPLYRTILRKPDTTVYKTCYADETMGPLSTVITHGAPTGSYSNLWVTEVVRNGSGQVTEVHTPANNDDQPPTVHGYDHSTWTFNRKSSEGLVNVYDRVSSGDMTGLPEAVKYKEGDSGTAYFTSWTQYTSHDYNLGTSVNVTRPMISARRSYYAATSTYSTANTYDETTMTYGWWGPNTASLLYIVPKQITTTLPVVTTAQLGSNSANSRTVYLRKDGTTAFALAEDGVYTYTQYTNLQLTKRIDDVKTNGTFPTGDDPNTDWGITETGNGSDRIVQATYDGQGRLSTITEPDGRLHQNYYSQLEDGRQVTIAWPRVTTGGTTTYYGPAQYKGTNKLGKLEFQAAIAITSSGLTDALTSWIDETSSDPITALHKGTVASMRTNLYTNSGHRLTESRVYFSLPGSGAGTENTNYDATRYGYDDDGRKTRLEMAGSTNSDNPGTVTRTVYDDLDRVSATWMGTNDSSFPDGDAVGTDNMVEITENTYDGGNDGGNSYLTTVTRFVEASTTGQRQTSYTYDFRGHALLTTAAAAPHTLVAVDNLGRVTASAQYTSTASITVGTTDPAGSGTSDKANRVALSTSLFDSLGRVYETRRYEINQGTGAIVQVSSVDQYVPTQTWCDAAGRVVEVKGAQLTKSLYDRLGRIIDQATLAVTDDTGYSDASTLTGDFVLEETKTTYESTDSDNVVMRATLRRHYDDLSTGTTGSLDSNADGNDFKYTMANVSARFASLEARWYDDLDRVTDTVQYGTNGGSDFDRKPSGVWLSVPTRSATALRTTYVYNDDGTILSVTDPRGKETRYAYDALFRKVTEIKNYVDGTPSGPTGDDDNYTRFTYANGRMTTMWVDFDGDGNVDTTGTPDQVTRYIYGTNSGSPASMAVSTGHLLRAVVYPDSSNTGTKAADIDSDASDVVSFAYNAQSQQIDREDQIGNTITTVYDDLGRKTDEKASVTGSTDTAILRISWAYLSSGLLDTVTSYDAASGGTAQNQVQYGYDGWWNVTTLTEDPDSAIGGGGRASSAISYTYELATTGRNTLRCTGMTYGSPTVTLAFNYTSTGNSLDADCSRVSTVTGAGGITATYKYNGLQQLVYEKNAEPNVEYKAYSSGHTYANLDNFDRWINSIWTSNNASHDLYSTAISYDEDGNITDITDNIVKNGSSQRCFDAKYDNDNLNRLTQADYGTFSAGSISNRSRREAWTLDQPGNWANSKWDSNGDLDYSDAGEFQEDRTFNKVNELTQRDIDTNNTAGYETTYSGITYDANGNLTNDKAQFVYVYDAWNRLVQIKKIGGSTVIAEYGYNGLNQRTMVHTDTNGSGTVDGSDKKYYLIYDLNWRVLEWYRETDTYSKLLYIMQNAGLDGKGSASYIDATMLWDGDENPGWANAADGTREKRRYTLQDQHQDVAVILTDTGSQVERVHYFAYGQAFGQPAGDLDGNGTWNATDSIGIKGTYDVLKDVNLDGSISAADVTAANAITGGYQTLGYNVLSSSSVNSRRGYCGYEYEPATEGYTPMYLARNRAYQPAMGRWLTRDFVEYADGMDLYSYVSDNPTEQLDPWGLSTKRCAQAARPGQGGQNNQIHSDCGEEIAAGGLTARQTCDLASSLALQDPTVQLMLSKMRTLGCPEPTIFCDCCQDLGVGGDVGGRTLCGTSYGPEPYIVIQLCMDNMAVLPFNQWLDTVLHEFTHAMDCCAGRPTGSCEQSLCSEARAYRRECNGDPQCVWRALQTYYCFSHPASPCCQYLQTSEAMTTFWRCFNSLPTEPPFPITLIPDFPLCR